MSYGPIRMDNARTHGDALFEGTDVPVKTFFEYLEDEKSVQQFLSDYPAVNRKQVNEILQMAKHAVTDEKILREIFQSTTAPTDTPES